VRAIYCPEFLSSFLWPLGDPGSATAVNPPLPPGVEAKTFVVTLEPESGLHEPQRGTAGIVGVGQWERWCPETELNRHVLLGTRDFKSRASASFAIRARWVKRMNLQRLL
jgi:hypothetical protein